MPFKSLRQSFGSFLDLKIADLHPHEKDHKERLMLLKETPCDKCGQVLKLHTLDGSANRICPEGN